MGEPVPIIELAKQMITLSGLTIKDENNPNGAIEIKLTGLRPGEKLYEEMLIDAKAEKTIHPLIFRAKEYSIPYIELIKKLEVLKENVENYSISKSLDLLKELVPEWSRK